MYEVLARYYDLFSDEQPWINFAVEAVRGKRKGADVGCGTGNVALALCCEHDVTALDSSPEMLRYAADKFLRHGVKIHTALQKAEELELPSKVDFITAMCDVVNYIRTPEKFFEAARRNLKDGGLLVFDISSEYKLKNTLGNNVFTQTRDGVTYVWENSLAKSKVDMTLTFFVPRGELYIKAVDEQTQYIHKTELITDALIGCGFEVEVTDKKDRIYFVAEKR